MKKCLIVLLLCLVPLSAWADCEPECGPNEVCVESCPECPPVAEGEEDEQDCECTSECVFLDDDPVIMDVPTCEEDSDCPFAMSCVEVEIPCFGDWEDSGTSEPMPAPDCVCDCEEGDVDCEENCDCGEVTEPVEESGEDCEPEILNVCQPNPCDENTACGENFSCEVVMSTCGESDGFAPEGETKDDADGEDSSSSSEGSTGEDKQDASGEEDPAADDGEDTQEEVEEVIEQEACEETLACMPVEIPCVTDEECPADWTCAEDYLDSDDTVTIEPVDGGCACPACPPGEECPPCDCDEDDAEEEEESIVEEAVVDDERVETEGMCAPPGWEDYFESFISEAVPGGSAEETGTRENQDEEGGELGEPENPEGENTETSEEVSADPTDDDETGGADEEGDEAGDAGEEGDEAGDAGEEDDEAGDADEAAAADSSSDDGCATRTGAPLALGMLLMLITLAAFRREETL